MCQCLASWVCGRTLPVESLHRCIGGCGGTPGRSGCGSGWSVRNPSPSGSDPWSSPARPPCCLKHTGSRKHTNVFHWRFWVYKSAEVCAEIILNQHFLWKRILWRLPALIEFSLLYDLTRVTAELQQSQKNEMKWTHSEVIEDVSLKGKDSFNKKRSKLVFSLNSRAVDRYLWFHSWIKINNFPRSILSIYKLCMNGCYMYIFLLDMWKLHLYVSKLGMPQSAKHRSERQKWDLLLHYNFVFQSLTIFKTKTVSRTYFRINLNKIFLIPKTLGDFI